MQIIKVNSEWDLGIPELYMWESTARKAVEDVLPKVGIEESLEELELEMLITFEVVEVVEG